MPLLTHVRSGSLSRRGFLRLCSALGGGLAASLVLPCWSTAGLDQALALPSSPDSMLLTGRVRTCAAASMGHRCYEDGAVFIHKGHIEQVGPRESVAVAADVPVLDLSGKTIVPGIIDAHVHEAASHNSRRSLLLLGVTTVGDVGSPVGDLALFRTTHDASGGLLAEVVGSGPMIGPENGYPGRVWPAGYGLAVTDWREGTAHAEGLLDQGAAMLKLGFEPGPNGAWPVLDFRVARAVVDVARDRGVPVRCHVQDGSCLDLAIEVGVDCVEHTLLRCFGQELFSGEPGRLEPGSWYAERLQRLADKGIMLVPTLQMAARAAWDGSGAIGAVRCFREFGGTVGLGTDAPMRGVEQGRFLEEMRLMHQAGMDDESILQAATMGAAKALGRGAEIGSIEPGKQADLMVVDGDPGENYQHLERVMMVMKQGIIVS